MCSHKKVDQLSYQDLGNRDGNFLQLAYQGETVLTQQLHFPNRVGKMAQLCFVGISSSEVRELLVALF